MLLPHQDLAQTDARQPLSGRLESGRLVGIFRLRQAIAEYLEPARGINTTPEQIIIVNWSWSREALNLASRLFIKDGYNCRYGVSVLPGSGLRIQKLGAQLNPIPMDNNGLNVSKLPLGRSVWPASHLHTNIRLE